MKYFIVGIALLFATPAVADYYSCKAKFTCTVDACGYVNGLTEEHGGTAWTTGCNMSGVAAIVDPDHNARCAKAVLRACEDSGVSHPDTQK